MKLRFKKSVSFTVTILCVVITMLAANGCRKSKTPSVNYTHGIIVGYTKCNTDSDAVRIGVFIITEKQDSLLSFNVPSVSIGIDTNVLKYGVYDIDGGNISFTYKVAENEEIKQIRDFICPQNAMDMPFSHGQIEDYKQIVIQNINSKYNETN